MEQCCQYNCANCRLSWTFRQQIIRPTNGPRLAPPANTRMIVIMWRALVCWSVGCDDLERKLISPNVEMQAAPLTLCDRAPVHGPSPGSQGGNAQGFRGVRGVMPRSHLCLFGSFRSGASTAGLRVAASVPRSHIRMSNRRPKLRRQPAFRQGGRSAPSMQDDCLQVYDIQARTAFLARSGYGHVPLFAFVTARRGVCTVDTSRRHGATMITHCRRGRCPIADGAHYRLGRRYEDHNRAHSDLCSSAPALLAVPCYCIPTVVHIHLLHHHTLNHG